MLTVHNLNAHPIRVERRDGSLYEYPPSGSLLRLQTVDEIIDTINGNPIIQRVYFEPENNIVPRPQKDVYYIVPSQVVQISNRPDFISPDTKAANGARRDHNGQVISVTRFRVRDILKPVQNGDRNEA